MRNCIFLPARDVRCAFAAGLDFEDSERLYCAVEFASRASPLYEDPTPCMSTSGFEYFPVAAKHAHCTLFVFGHHLAVAYDISAQDRCEPSCERLYALCVDSLGIVYSRICVKLLLVPELSRPISPDTIR